MVMCLSSFSTSLIPRIQELLVDLRRESRRKLVQPAITVKADSSEPFVTFTPKDDAFEIY